MYLKLDLKEDEDFRKHIKELMESQVRSIVRQELASASSELNEFKKHLNVVIQNTVKTMARTTVEHHIQKHMFDHWGHLNSDYKKIIKEYFEKGVQHFIRDNPFDKAELQELVANKVKAQLIG